jgi:hypothetical protein
LRWNLGEEFADVKVPQTHAPTEEAEVHFGD